MKLRQFIVAAVIALVLGISTASCALVQDLFDDKVVTTLDNVKPEDKASAVPIDLSLIPQEYHDLFDANGKRLVLVDKDSVIDHTKAEDISDPELGGLVDLGLQVAKTVWPGVAALEGLALLFSSRKRKHYGQALGKALPVNGKVELKDAVVSLARAIGVAHSSEKSKEAFEQENKKVA